MHKVVVIGGGAAGMMAAIASAQSGNEVVLLEKNEKLGKKIYITGKGRCNLTACVDNNEFFNNVVNNPKFLYGAINTLSPYKLMSFFEENGLSLKEERGNRVFPQSDKASDVTKCLEKKLINLGVDVRFNTRVVKVLTQNNGSVCGVLTEFGQIDCQSVIICTGGFSYQSTGSSGDGYTFAKQLGHSIIELRPALVGLELKGSDFASLQGLSLKNVRLSAYFGDKCCFSDFGEMLFTHFGISGPIVLSCSSKINRLNTSNIKVVIDLKPALSAEQLNSRLLREFKENNTKNLSTTFRALLPKSMIDVILRDAKVNANKNCSEVTSQERQRLIFVLKNLTFEVNKLRPIDEAIITSGGVNVKELNPKTMESKIVKGLFFAGEVIDVDAFTGGFNLQIAFSTGYVAGLNS